MKFSAFCFTFLMSGAVHAETIKLLTEEYPPYNFAENGVVRGASVEQTERIMSSLGISYTLDILPWARALALTEKQPSTCLFTTAHDEDRDNRFKWVEPLLVDRMIMVRKLGSGVNPTTIEEARQFTVGTQREDFSANFLKRNGFPKVDLATDLEATAKKLIAGRVDLMMTSEKTFETMRDQGKPVESALVLKGMVYGMACNLDTPDDLVARMQKSLDVLIADGTQQKIFAKYGLRTDD
ncbi:substrate-binding periplasmic protein [Pararhizobium gei]|uniref:substrate-binding periplasmic protein n=1 Tax=Pararhizobium gei TaxID=1395951 RepID=UPI0023D9E839|nr:transporter substrate-binding domain-containing protein [Rhizobium gei]